MNPWSIAWTLHEAPSVEITITTDGLTETFSTKLVGGQLEPA